MWKQTLLAIISALALGTGPGWADTNNTAGWDEVKAKADGQTVYYHAWGGEPRINAYIEWAAGEMKDRYGVTVEHVKVTETANVVTQIIAEKTAGRDTGGSVDLVWINGENFSTLKSRGLLADPGWAEALPNWQYVDVEGKPTVVSDFTIPTDGQESPWGMAQLVFMHDTRRLPQPPLSLAELSQYVAENPGRFSYPQPPEFFGTTFLKQALITLIADPAKLAKPVEEATFDQDVKPLFDYLDQIHPNLWRRGETFPRNAAHMRQLLGDGEVDIAFTFNPGDATSAIENGELPDTVRTFVLRGGTIGNTHFVAIPFNSSSKEGAKLLADFLLSPEAQARKQDPKVWGDPTVLNVSALPDPDRAHFEKLELGVATLSPEELGTTLPEPHPSWVTMLERAWAQRYGGS